MSHVLLPASIAEMLAELPEWQERASCPQTDPEAFFGSGLGSHYSTVARRVCQRCEVRIECLEYALEHNEPHGMWGGLGETERRRLRRDRDRRRDAA